MADSMRGSRLGSTSYETDSGLSAPRMLTTYVCPSDHKITLPFFIEADEIPDTWDCDCGQLALRLGKDQPIKKALKPVKSHYDMLLERRSKGDLSELLKERLDLLRGAAKKAS